MNTGFITPAFIISFTNIPGILSTYVLLCPLKKVVSAAPAQLINRHYLSSDLAIALAIDVFPVPGGPFNNNMNPLLLSFDFLSWLTAIIS